MERLQKVIAHAGVASRRKAEELIGQGRVKVNGKVVRELGTKVGPNDKIEVDEVPVESEAKHKGLETPPAVPPGPLPAPF